MENQNDGLFKSVERDSKASECDVNHLLGFPGCVVQKFEY